MAEVEAGWVIENPVTAERAIVLEAPRQNPSRRLVAEVHVGPGGAVVGDHRHPAITESFQVIDGELGVSVDGRKSRLAAGERVEIPPERWHDWWNSGGVTAVVRIEVTPADRFVEMIRTIFGLGLDGKTNAKGMPRPLQLIAIGQEFSDVVVFRRPPPLVQRISGALIGPLARRRGYRGTYPRYAEAESMGTPEQARSGAPLTARFGAGPGPPG